ncbi:unnamed protein product [Heterobilharzia americana]|nr:unnamed protein product [Heterobilharzia americana]
MEIFPNTCRSTKIIVNADDGFYSDIRDQGIVSCLSAAGYGASDVSILNNFIPGLHFNLTEGKSLTNEKSIHSLLDHRGCFLGKFGFRKHLMSSAINMTEAH